MAIDRKPYNQAAFCTTHWSVVVAAQNDESSRAEEALAELCRTYWYPLYAFVRRRGNSPAEAEDLTQAFFARLLEKNYIAQFRPGIGRFRTFLLTSLKHFLANEWDRAQAVKRGGGKVILSFNDADQEARYRFEPSEHMTPETLFEKRWALTLLECVLAKLRSEFVADEKSDLFDHLKAFISSDDTGKSYTEIAAATGLKEGTVKVAVHRLRKRYGELLCAEIRNTVEDPAEVEEELRHLIAVLGQ